MASATGIPEENPAANHRSAEDEPLLGRRGDASQQEGQGIQFNLVLGIYLPLSQPPLPQQPDNKPLTPLSIPQAPP